MIRRDDCGIQWAQAAAVLGFETRASRSSLLACSDWDAIRALPGGPITPVAATADLMIGRRRNRDVLVACTDIVKLTRSQTHFLGIRTHVVVPILPRLHLGLSIVAERAAVSAFDRDPTAPYEAPPDRWTPDVAVGDPELDAAYHVWSASPERAQTLLRRVRHDGRDLADALTSLARRNWLVDVVDSFVHVWANTIVLDPNVLGAILDEAAWIADALVGARRAMPPAEYETRYLAALDASGLEVDRDDMSATGVVDGIPVAAHVGSIRARIFTIVGATIPAPIVQTLRIDRWTTPSFDGPFGYMPAGGIELGIPDLRVVGHPEADVRRAVHGVRTVLAAVLAHGDAIHVIGNLVRLELPNIARSGGELRGAIDAAVSLAKGLSAHVPPPEAGPYR